MKLSLSDWKNLSVVSGLVAFAMLLKFLTIGWMMVAMFSIYCLMMYNREKTKLEKKKEMKK